MITMKAEVTPVALAGNDLIEISLRIDQVICPEEIESPILQDIRLLVKDSGLYVRRYAENGPYPMSWSQAKRATITIALESA